MAKAYYSTVFDAPAADVWQIVRNFNNYPVWVDGAGESEIEDGKSGDTVGAIRSVHYQGRRIRQRLLAQSDPERRNANLRICRTGPSADHRFSGDDQDHANHRGQQEPCRMVGDLRL